MELHSSPTKARSLGKDHKGWKTIPQRGRFMLSRPPLPFDFYRLPHFSRHLILCATGFVRQPLFRTNNNIVFEEIWWPKAKTQTILWWTLPLKSSHSRKVCSRKPQNFEWSNCDVFQCIVFETLLWLTLCNSVLPVRQPPIEPALESSRPGLLCEAQTIKSCTIFSIEKETFTPKHLLIFFETKICTDRFFFINVKDFCKFCYFSV